MASYCTVSDVQNILPKNVNIGTNLLKGDINVTETEVNYWITSASGIVDGYLSAFYRTPLVTYKEPNYSVAPVTFTELYPPPIVLITARLSAGHIYDEIIMANQEPNVSDWGKNQRALAFDDLTQIQTGLIQLRGQTRTGRRFVRQELFDSPRVPFHSDLQTHGRSPGE